MADHAFSFFPRKVGSFISFNILCIFSRDSDLTTTNISPSVSQSVSQQIVKSSLNQSIYIMISGPPINRAGVVKVQSNVGRGMGGAKI